MNTAGRHMANLYDLKKFDLNLLVVFECIYQNLSISKAAETLYITPSAVSQSLQRLRTQFNDPLFIRSGKGITPTVAGINLHYHLEANLNNLEQTINIMHESELKKKFIMYSPPIFISKIMMSLINIIRQSNDIEIEHHDILMTQESIEDLLTYRKADLIVSMSPVVNRSIICTPLTPIDSVLVCSKNHPRIHDNATVEEILKEQFTLLTNEDPGLREYQMIADTFLMNRKIGFKSKSLIAVINTIASTDIIGFVPAMMLDFYQPVFALKKINIPFSIPPVQLYYMYNRASLNNKGFAQFISRITEIIQ